MRRRERKRVLVPLDLSTLFVPFDFSILLGNRRQKSPVENRPLTLVDLVVGIAFAVVAYGPGIAGGVIGWHRGDGWVGAAIGVGLAITAQAAVVVLVAPVVALVRSRNQR